MPHVITHKSFCNFLNIRLGIANQQFLQTDREPIHVLYEDVIACDQNLAAPFFLLKFGLLARLG